MIDSEIIGSFIQYPMRLAWAITIHKSQGKTFKKVNIDFEKGTFAPGQAYVALSRCVSLKGISLEKEIRQSDIKTDYRIVKFLTKFQYCLSERKMPSRRKKLILLNAIKRRKKVEILYLRPNGDKTRRIIAPCNLGNLDYNGKMFFGVKGFCEKSKEERVFRVDRILDMAIV